VAEQFHQGRKIDAAAKHLAGVGVSELMRDDAPGRRRLLAGLESHVIEQDGLSTEPALIPAMRRPRHALQPRRAAAPDSAAFSMRC
jgi:hypothetical protein